MKKIKKIISALSIAMTSTFVFAQSASNGVDPSGQGLITASGVWVGSCSAPTISVTLGDIDFHVAKNGPTGVYEHPVPITVACTNPNQTWTIFSHTSSFTFNNGVNGNNTEQGYVSLSNTTANPGLKFGDLSEYVGALNGGATYDQSSHLLQRAFAAYGIGNTTYVSKLTFGKTLPAGAIADEVYAGTNGMPSTNSGIDSANVVSGAVPMGTIDGRGAFSVDIPLVIYY
jgi:hypothetical protein